MHSSSFQEIRTSQLNYMRTSSYRNIDYVKKESMTESMKKSMIMMTSENEHSPENVIPTKNSMEIYLPLFNEEKSINELDINIESLENKNDIPNIKVVESPAFNPSSLRLSVTISNAAKTQLGSGKVDSP